MGHWESTLPQTLAFACESRSVRCHFVKYFLRNTATELKTFQTTVTAASNLGGWKDVCRVPRKFLVLISS